jgi:hypothetical protein
MRNRTKRVEDLPPVETVPDLYIQYGMRPKRMTTFRIVDGKPCGCVAGLMAVHRAGGIPESDEDRGRLIFTDGIETDCRTGLAEGFDGNDLGASMMIEDVELARPFHEYGVKAWEACIERGLLRV